MRQINGKRLKQWIENHGDDAKVRLHLKSRVSLTWIEKVISGRYQSVPRQLTQEALCDATGLSLDELFPPVTAGAKRRTKIAI